MDRGGREVKARSCRGSRPRYLCCSGIRKRMDNLSRYIFRVINKHTGDEHFFERLRSVSIR